MNNMQSGSVTCRYHHPGISFVRSEEWGVLKVSRTHYTRLLHRRFPVIKWEDQNLPELVGTLICRIMYGSTWRRSRSAISMELDQWTAMRSPGQRLCRVAVRRADVATYPLFMGLL